MSAKVARVRIAEEYLASVLPLPDDTSILDATWLPESGGIELLVQNPRLAPVAEGNKAPRRTLWITILQPGGRRHAEFERIDPSGAASEDIPPEMAVSGGNIND